MTESITEREWLATRVMRWEKIQWPEDGLVSGEAFIDPDGESLWLHWNPYENTDALLDKFLDWSIDRVQGHYVVTILLTSNGQVTKFEADNNELKNAIVEAVLQASGWEG